MKKLLLILVFGILASPVSAAVVYLKDGSQVRGTIVSATARTVRLHTANGELNIQADDIRRVDYAEDEPQVVPTASGPANPVEPRVHHGRRDEAEDDESSENQMFSLGFGFANPLSRVSLASTGGGSGDNGDAGLLLSTQYHYFLTPRFALGADLEFMNRGRTASQSMLPAADTSVFGHSTVLMATARYSLTNRGTARPYILAGIGSNKTATIIEATPNPGFGWSDTSTTETRTLVDENHWGLASTARFGIDFMLADPALFSLEFGWTEMSNSQYNATRSGQDLGLEHVTGNLSILTVGARWGWRF